MKDVTNEELHEGSEQPAGHTADKVKDVTGEELHKGSEQSTGQTAEVGSLTLLMEHRKGNQKLASDADVEECTSTAPCKPLQEKTVGQPTEAQPQTTVKPNKSKGAKRKAAQQLSSPAKKKRGKVTTATKGLDEQDEVKKV